MSSRTSTFVAPFALIAVTAATGCGGTFSLSGPAHYEVPSARAATLLTSSATVRKYEVRSADGALAEVRPIAAGTLLDFVKITPDGFVGVSRKCGALELADLATGAARWSHTRDGDCKWPVFEIAGALVTLEDRRAGGASSTVLSRIDPATGKVGSTASAAKIVSSVAAFGDDLVTLEGDEKAATIVLRAGDTLKPRWSIPIEETRQIVAGPGVIYAVGTRHVIAIDPASGRRRATASIASKLPLTLTAFSGGALVTVSQGDDGKPAVVAIGADGAVKWTAHDMALGLAHDDVAVLISDQEAVLVQTADGAIRWRTKLGSEISGRPIFAGADKLVLVPQRLGVLALDATTGAKTFDVPADATEPLVRHLDQLITDDSGLVILDSWRNVTAFDLTGKVQYTFHVRSVALGHREERSADANAEVPFYNQKFESAAIITSTFGTEPLGPQHAGLMTTDGKINTGSLGMNGAMTVGTAQMTMAMSDYANTMAQINANNMNRTIGERRNAQFAVAQRESAVNELSPYILRPITWNVGRGYLVVRKSDGAFAEVVTGPSDLFEDKFRESSMGFYDANAGVVVAFTEGTANASWELAEVSPPVQLVKRRLMGFNLKPDAFRPANTYATTSKIPDGSFTWHTEAK